MESRLSSPLARILYAIPDALVASAAILLLAIGPATAAQHTIGWYLGAWCALLGCGALATLAGTVLPIGSADTKMLDLSAGLLLVGRVLASGMLVTYALSTLPAGLRVVPSALLLSALASCYIAPLALQAVTIVKVEITQRRSEVP